MKSRKEIFLGFLALWGINLPIALFLVLLTSLNLSSVPEEPFLLLPWVINFAFVGYALVYRPYMLLGYFTLFAVAICLAILAGVTVSAGCFMLIAGTLVWLSFFQIWQTNALLGIVALMIFLILCGVALYFLAFSVSHVFRNLTSTVAVQFSGPLMWAMLQTFLGLGVLLVGSYGLVMFLAYHIQQFLTLFEPPITQTQAERLGLLAQTVGLIQLTVIILFFFWRVMWSKFKEIYYTL